MTVSRSVGYNEISEKRKTVAHGLDFRAAQKGKGMPPIHILVKPASGLCNMRCTYCFYADEMSKREQSSYGIMSIETLEQVIKKTLAFAEEECTIAYQGGEPTLAGLDFFRQSIRFQEQYNCNRVKISNAIQTNGLCLDEEWCRFLAEHHFLVGLSVDGVKATHDVYRKDAAGQDTYFRVLEAAKRMDRFHVDYNILTVINSKTAPKIRKIYEQFAKQGFGYQQYIACLDPLGEEQGQQEYSLTPEAYGRFLIDLFELWELDLRKGKQPYIRQFDNWIGILMGLLPEACDQRGVCGIQNVVEADGSVYPCDFYVLDEYRMGNLMDDDMEQIYRNREALGFREQSRNHPESCRACKYLQVCRGGCRRHRESEDHLNLFCKSYQMFFDTHYETMKQIADAFRRRR